VPELPEIEYYRRLAERALHRPVRQVMAPDAWYLKQGLTARAVGAALRGRSFTAARRRGKLLVLDTADGPALGLRFGMTGRLLVDGVAGLGRLEYGSARAVQAWDRFVVRFEDGGDLRVRDPRRLGGVFLDPPEHVLGPDALAVTPAELRAALAGSEVALKARIMDQRRLAGLGNLLVDEVLWRAGLDPARAAGSLTAGEVRRLHRHVVATVEDLIERGGSHSGDVHPERRPGGVCPRDGEPLVRRTIGGRTTWSCPRHQR
jgi:formamidopyrimidine-DNA glycosylase